MLWLIICFIKLVISEVFETINDCSLLERLFFSDSPLVSSFVYILQCSSPLPNLQFFEFPKAVLVYSLALSPAFPFFQLTSPTVRAIHAVNQPLHPHLSAELLHKSGSILLILLG